MTRREQLLVSVQADPAGIVDLVLALEARVAALEARLAQNSSNSGRPATAWANRRHAAYVSAG